MSAVLVATVSFFGQWFTSRREWRRIKADNWSRALNELYAPVVLLLDQNWLIKQRLKSGKVGDAHLLDKIDDVRGDTVDLSLAQRIVAINAQISNIVEAKVGLTISSVPASFSLFLSHHQMLEAAVQGLPFLKEPAEAQYFPKAFEEDIRKGHNQLLSKLDKHFKDADQ